VGKIVMRISFVRHAMFVFADDGETLEVP